MLLQKSKEQLREALAVRLFTRDLISISAICARMPLQKTRERKRGKVTQVFIFVSQLLMFSIHHFNVMADKAPNENRMAAYKPPPPLPPPRL